MKNKFSLRKIYLSILNFFWKYPFFREFYIFIRLQKFVTKLRGPTRKRSHTQIELDITYACNLHCFNCNRSCGQAPSKDQISIGQIKKFIDESIENKISWQRIHITGGEPTLHPDLTTILELLLEYKKNYSPGTLIELATNGYGKQVKAVLSKMPKGIEVENTSKESRAMPFLPFNIAPKDLPHYKFADYSTGCITSSSCGIALTPFGYYSCALAGGIDRVLGLDIGRKQMPGPDDEMTDQMRTFCRYCGKFRASVRVRRRTVKKEIISPFWVTAYNKYMKKKPPMTLY